MPPITRWHIKTALGYFVAALGVGVALSLRAITDLPPVFGLLGPVYFHLLMVGWVTQLIFGVALWMFPKFSPDQPRGNERLNWAVYGLLNVGLLLRVVAEPLLALEAHPLLGGMVALSAVLQWLAGIGFVVNLWRRVKEK